MQSNKQILDTGLWILEKKAGFFTASSIPDESEFPLRSDKHRASSIGSFFRINVTIDTSLLVDSRQSFAIYFSL